MKPDINKMMNEIDEYIRFCEEVKENANKRLAEFKDTKEIKHLNEMINYLKEGSLHILTDSEFEKVKEFKFKHYKSCNNDGYWYRITPTGIGTNIHIKCDKCGEELDITDYDCW